MAAPSFPRPPANIRGFNGVLGLRSSLSFWAAQALTWATWSIAPLSLCYLGYTVRFPLKFSLVLAGPALVESLFIPYAFIRAYLNSQTRLQLPFPPSERRQVMDRILQHMETTAGKTKCIDCKDGTKVVPGACDDDCPHTLVRGWMRGAPWESCTETGARSWISWAIFNSIFNELSSYQKLEVNEYIEDMFERTGLRFQNSGGTVESGDSTPIRLTLDKIVWQHRPLVAYLVTDLLVGRIIFPLVMRSMGFRLLNGGGDSADVRHWYKPGRAVKSEDTADGVYFAHGVGIGALPYIDLLRRIYSTTDGLPQLVYDYGPIALRLSLPDVRGCDATAAAIAKAMREVGMERATLVGHSFGTVVASWVLRHCPEHIHSTVLIDPVSLQLARADVAFAAIHRKPVSAADVLLEYFVFREQSLAITLARHFIWYKNIMWADDLPKEGRAVAFLSSNDVIVPSASVRNYLKDHGVESRWLENCGHAGFLKKTQWIEDIAKEVGRRGATSVGGTKKSN